MAAKYTIEELTEILRELRKGQRVLERVYDMLHGDDNSKDSINKTLTSIYRYGDNYAIMLGDAIAEAMLEDAIVEMEE